MLDDQNPNSQTPDAPSLAPATPSAKKSKARAALGELTQQEAALQAMHDGAIELEPAYVEVAPDGGWGQIVEDLEIIQLHGDHLAIVDEPEIATVGAVITQRLREDAEAAQE